MSKNYKRALLALGALCACAYAQDASITVDAGATSHPISPYIYGKNHGLNQEIGKSTSADTIKRYQDAGIRMLRLNNGNNASKYHFRKKLSSHPDWYNNVVPQDWDLSAQELQTKLPGVQGLYAISMLGWAASNTEHNFDDWLYNGSKWWWDTEANESGTSHDWAGTTPIKAAGEKPTGNPVPSLYLEQWPSDSSVKILDHWFGGETGSLGLDKSQFVYWNMDNEPDIWNGTHSDISSDTLTAEGFVKTYVYAAKLARAKYPGIKLVGPVATNEWQWFYWHGKLVPCQVAGRDTTLPFVEFFIKRIAEEQKASGVRLLDVFDYHFYPGLDQTSDKKHIAQMHRVWYDSTYIFPKANAVKMALGSSSEYILGRTRAWLDSYFGKGHGITLGISEFGAIDGAKSDASLIAVWYASQLGEFAKQGDVELFTPWTLYDGMFETLHLFTRYAKAQYVPSTSSLDSLVSAYSSLNAKGDSLTVVLVNRDLQSERTAKVQLNGFAHGGSWAPTFRLADLSGETFYSKTKNALYANGVSVASGAFSIPLPKASVTAVVFSTTDPGTMPEFSSSSAASSSSSSSSTQGKSVVVWDYSMGHQVQQPDGSEGGWWYNYADTLSTLTALSPENTAADKALHMVFSAKQNEEQPWNYAGLGFSWGSTPAGKDLATANLSAYSHLCLDYQSDVDLQAAIGQPSAKDATKQTTYPTGADALPANTKRTNVCIPFTDFSAGAALNLGKQSGFQLQVSESADFTLYQVSLLEGTSPILATPSSYAGRLQASVQGSMLRLSFEGGARSIRLLDLQGRPVRQWTASEGQALSLASLPSGRYWAQVMGVGIAPVLLAP